MKEFYFGKLSVTFILYGLCQFGFKISQAHKRKIFFEMVKYILFSDPLRQEEIETFYTASQMHRDFYRGYPRSYHPLKMFREPGYMWQCPSEMSAVYLSFPPYHVRYKPVALLPLTLERTSEMPTLPGRTLAGRYSKGPCKVFMR